MNTTNKILLAVVIITLLFILKLCSDSKPNSTSDETSTKSIIGTGRINSFVDGVEVGEVNLWTATNSSRTIECSVIKGQKVRITEDADPYYFVEAVGRSGCEGYCLKEFVVRD